MTTAAGGESSAAGETRPALTIVNPDVTAEEVAAIVAVLASLGGGEPAPRPPRSEWANPARRVRGDLARGAGAWRASGLPR
ncbi:Acyl-CoA carboxylase epsilon subunit [Nocardioides terrae]|uniref:Acyl-CoA carboxylase epsilon subunit n=1 Tax=Nocardioides terrae TaxID=574651 RepID=A0A1I1DSY6_9ACTN|nr:acyl-CoA carboxylase subunit epsilon [Nocardioides terrae]SFB76138.1 Acyl-CoA carboxylase epsilon subunit [Nocardioides terrae]